MLTEKIKYFTEGGGSRLGPLPTEVLHITGFRPSLFASLVSGATASRSSGIVTVVAPSHGIPQNSLFTGFRFFYPGSPYLAAGWYDSIVSIVDANTITFNAPGSNFSSEEINTGNPYINLFKRIVKFCIPANTLKIGSKIVFDLYRSGDTGAGNKTFKVVYGDSDLSECTRTTLPHSIEKLAFINYDINKQWGTGNSQENPSGSCMSSNVDTSLINDLELKVSLSDAGSFIILYGVYVKITTP